MKLKVWVGLLVGWVTVKVRLVLPPTMRSAANILLTVGTAAVTVTQAPALGVTPLVALGVITAVMFVVVLMLLFVLAFGASVQAPTDGAAAVVIGTMMVQVVAGLTIWRPVTTMLLLPAVAVTVPDVQVPVTAAPLATRPAGRVSVKLKVWVGLLVGWVTVKVRLVLPPTVRFALKTLLTVGTACVTVRLAAAVLPFNGPVADTIPDVLLYVPMVGIETTTLSVQTLSAGIVPPVSVTDAAAATGVNVPPQVLVNVAGLATTMFPGATGNVSVKPTPVITAGVPLVMVNVNVLFCPS